MYSQSTDLRFVKNRTALQRAFIDLTLEKQSTRITVKELAERANVNRMTFYAHYDAVSDILLELLDEMTAELMEANIEVSGLKADVEALLKKATEMMREEIGFYQLVARNDGFEQYRAQFRHSFERIFRNMLDERCALQGPTRQLASDMLASSITYAYIDWLACKYEGLTLDELIAFCQKSIESQLESWMG